MFKYFSSSPRIKTLSKQLSQLSELYSIFPSKIEPQNLITFVMSRDNLHCDSVDDCWKATPRLWDHRTGELTQVPYCWESALPGLTRALEHNLKHWTLCGWAESQAEKHSKNESKSIHGNNSKDWELKPPLWKQGTTKIGKQLNALKSPTILTKIQS